MPTLAKSVPARSAVILPALLLLVTTVLLGYFTQQDQFVRIAGGYGIAFLAYAYILSTGQDAQTLRFWLLFAALLRLLLLFAFPGLSDDLYRFIWDGRLLAAGLNPFDQLPGYYLEAEHAVAGLTPDLYAELNSPDYYTIYPPVAQTVFGLACLLFPRSLFGAMVVMKLFLIACEIFSLWLLPRLLQRFGMPARQALIYALNPLIIVEISGNLHFEGAMIAFFLAGLYLLLNRRLAVAGCALALSIASKLLTAIFLPYFVRQLGWKRTLGLYLFTGGISLLLFAPLLSGAFLGNFGDSLDLYFRKFEFNAGIYYVLRWLGYQWEGYNLIAWFGPALAGIATTGILLFAFFHPGSWRSTLRYMLFGICLYLALATTVHPWYLSLPVLLAGFTHFRFPLLWSALIPLTYINYSYPEYQENLWVVALEYLLTGAWFLYEVNLHMRGRQEALLR